MAPCSLAGDEEWTCWLPSSLNELEGGCGVRVGCLHLLSLETCPAIPCHSVGPGSSPGKGLRRGSVDSCVSATMTGTARYRGMGAMGGRRGVLAQHRHPRRGQWGSQQLSPPARTCLGTRRGFAGDRVERVRVAASASPCWCAPSVSAAAPRRLALASPHDWGVLCPHPSGGQAGACAWTVLTDVEESRNAKSDHHPVVCLGSRSWSGGQGIGTAQFLSGLLRKCWLPSQSPRL